MDDIRDPKDRSRRAGRRALPRWAPVPLGAAAGLLAGLGYGLAATPQYAATSYVMAVAQPGAESATALGFAQAYGRIATGSAVLAAAQAGAHLPAASLKSRVAAATSPDAPMISVTGSAPRAGAAADIANAVSRSLAALANKDAASTGVRLLVFSPATAPTAPSSPSAALSSAVGAAAGGLLGALVLLVRPARENDPEPARLPAPTAPTPERTPV
jgi:capsular polysaccharide biosynthesis protein